MLQAAEFRRLSANPGILRKLYEARAATATGASPPAIVDEVQKLPELLDEVHSLISGRAVRFMRCGSSARKLVRGGGNLLGGRAVRLELGPLTSAEVPASSLERALNHGLLSRHYLDDEPAQLLQA